MKTTLLVADDDPAIRQAVRFILMNEPFEVLEAGTLEETHQVIVKSQPDILLLDVHFQGAETSLALLKQLSAEGISLPTLMLSGAASPQEAASAIKAGAYDYLDKPVTAERLKLTLERCIEHTKLRTFFKSMTIEHNNSSDLLGRSPEIEKIRKQITQVASRDLKVLLTGETGVGKEVVAQRIWKESARSKKPYIVINAAAIPETLIESELFGHKKGSFTGATSDQVGKIEMANGGTLFLDEIGELPKNAQSTLLRFLETGEIQKLGSHQIIKVDVRVIAATSRDLKAEMAKGHFRADLYYRLNVASIEIPPLRQRREDISLLFVFFVANFAHKLGEEAPTLEDEVFELLKRHPWPGNVRELRNVAERALASAMGRITRHHIVQILGSQLMDGTVESTNGVALALGEGMTLKDFKNSAEKIYIESVLAKVNGSVTKAAEILGIDRTYLHQKMSKLKVGKTSQE
jgi:two-component system nitrogen regulation response regulator NtrX